MSNQSELIVIITLIIGFFSQSIAMWIQWKKDARNREWDLEDRKQIAAKLEMEALKLRQRHIESQAMLAENTKITRAMGDAAEIAAKENAAVNEEIKVLVKNGNGNGNGGPK